MKIQFISTQIHRVFPAADTEIANTDVNTTEPKQPVWQLQYVLLQVILLYLL